jgi:hypothetical protein
VQASGLHCLLLAVLCFLAYAPALGLPLIEDDYPNLAQSQVYGAPSALPALAGHPVYRVRSTSEWTMYWMWRLAGLRPWAYHLLSLALHIVNTWLLFAICLAWPQFRPAAFWAAAFFAVAEGHQEAVMWFSAINELWLFLFGALALWAWRKDRAWGVAPFTLALISKESAVILLPLFYLAAPHRNWRRWLPYAAVAAVVTGSIFLGPATFRFGDGSFSWRAPFWITWPRGVARVLWPWGWLALAAVWITRDRKALQTAGLALAWIAIALLPYAFLTYSTEIPSRQTYLASAGLAMLVGLALSRMPDLYFPGRYVPGFRVAWAVMALIVIQNIGYLWTKKRSQFLERAAPTEQLIAFARRTPGPIWVRDFPRVPWIAEEAVHLGAGHPASDVVWTAAEAKARGAVEFRITASRRR